MNMEDLQLLWQKANLDELPADQFFRPDELIPQIIKLERDQERLVTVKTSVALGVILILMVLFFNRMEFSWSRIAGMGIFISSVLVIIILLNRWRFRITHRERSLSTVDLVAITEKKIWRERRVFSLYLPLFGIVALTGFNLMYLDYFGDLDPGTRLIYHGILTGGLLIAFIIGLSVRIRRFRLRFQPLLERIEKFRSDISH